jgi:integrase
MRRLRVVRVSKPSTPWMVAVPAALTGTKRVKRYFKEREAALAYIITLKQRGFLTVEEPQGGKATLGECAALWLARNEAHRGTFFQCRQVLTPLVARHGRDPVDAVTHRQLDAWLRSVSLSGLAPATVRNYWRITRRFFNFCRDFLEVVARNPMVKLTEPRNEHRDPAVLTPEQMKACLEFSVREGKTGNLLTAYVVLGAFGGLRTEEILRQRWEDIDWVSGEIYVRQPKRVRGWRPRHVEILPALRRHLEPIAAENGVVILGGLRQLYLARRELRHRLGLRAWPKNCLRHSFRTYHAAHFQDLPKLALQMGHASLGMTAYVYGTPATRVAAASWWAL